MFFKRPGQSVGSCLGSLIAFAAVMAVIWICIAYFGAIVLVCFLGAGVFVGAVYAVISYVRAFPDSINDVATYSFAGRPALVFSKKVGYFQICLAKYSFGYDIDYAKRIFARFSAKPFLSFAKWMYFALAVSVIVFGIAVLIVMLAVNSVVILTLFVGWFAGIAVYALAIIAAGTVTMFVVALIIPFTRIGSSFTSSCYRFAGRNAFSEIPAIASRYFLQEKDWTAAVWNGDLSYAASKRYSSQGKAWLSPATVFAFGLTCFAPIFAVITLFIGTIASFAIFLCVYVINCLWITVRRIFP